MSESKYENFDIIVTKQPDNTYTVRAEYSRGGEASVAGQTFPLNSSEFQDLLGALATLTGDLGQAEAAGALMRDCLFPPDIWALFIRSRSDARAGGKYLRLRLRIEPPEISMLPWEYCFDKDYRFFAWRREMPLVRYVARPFTPDDIKSPRPTKVLLTTASPNEWDTLDAKVEAAYVRDGLQGLDDIEVDVLNNVTWDSLQMHLKTFKPHVLHFIGHGEFDIGSGQGKLVLENESGGPHLVSATRFANQLQGSGVKVVVLNACKTAAHSHNDAFMGIAPALVRAEIPAVIAMQFAIPDDTARRFAQQLYCYLALGEPLDRAITEARINISGYDDVFWAIPVLFMRARDGVIWQPPDVEPADWEPESLGVEADLIVSPSSVDGESLPQISMRHERQVARIDKETAQVDEIRGKKVQESEILIALYNHFKSHPDSQKMTFAELYEAIGISLLDKTKAGEVRYQLFSLQNKGWIKYQSFEGDQGVVEITPNGKQVAQDMQPIAVPTSDLKPSKSCHAEESEETVAEAGISKLHLSSLEELLQKDPVLARLIQRDELLQRVVKCIDETPDECHIIVLSGQPLVGKTKLLYRLREALEDKYVPLMVTEQGLELGNTLNDFDAFVFDLADQLTNQFGKWAKSHGVSILDHPKLSDFKGKGNTAFSAHWRSLLQTAGQRRPVVIFDEIERLLDFEELDQRILTFLDYFVRDPNNGHFILAGSERIQFAMNEQFSRLIARGKPIQVCHHDEKAVHTIFSRVQEHLAYESQALQHLIALCDGHPRILNVILDTTFDLASRSPGKRRIEQNDIESILTTALKQIDDSLWLLRLRLSQEELALSWLISQRIPRLIDRLVYSLNELVELASQYSNGSTTDHAQDPPDIFQSTPSEQFYALFRKGAADLNKREWVEWQNWDEELLCFKLGIFPLWVRRRHINIDQVQH